MQVVIPAAGTSSRMGRSTEGRSKTTFPLLGEKSPLDFVLDTVSELDPERVVTLGREEDLPGLKSLIRKKDLGDRYIAAIGGSSRQETVRLGLELLEKNEDLVLVHDAARPCVTLDKILCVVELARQSGAAILATPVKQTLKDVGLDGAIRSTISRENLWAAQTPQVFLLKHLKKAHAEAKRDGFVATDDSHLVERLGYPVKVVAGDDSNIKITTEEDLMLARSILSARRSPVPQGES